MAKPIFEIIPDPEMLLGLEPEELAGIVLNYLHSLSGTESMNHLGNFLGSQNVTGYPHQYQDRIKDALTEAWGYLESQGLISPRPHSGPG
jgi:hypothetical protein